MSDDRQKDDARARAGFSVFFRDPSEVPNPPVERLVELKKLTVVLHCSRPLDENVGAMIPPDGLLKIKRKAAAVFAKMAPVIREVFGLDDDLYYDVGRRFIRLIFGPIEVEAVIERPVDPKKKTRLKGTAYVVATVHDIRIATISLILPIRPEGEFSISPSTAVTADDVQRLVDICFYNLDGFAFSGKPHKLKEFLWDLLDQFVSSCGYPQRARHVDPQVHISIYIWETAPDFDDIALEFAKSHAYEFFAMLGEELDWRDKTKDLVMKRMMCGKSLSRDDLYIPCNYTSVVIDRSPDLPEFFQRFSVDRYSFLDLHVLAAHTAFLAFRQTVDNVISECAQMESVDYPAAMEKLNALYLRYLSLRGRMYDIDHYWNDIGFKDYVNCKKEFSYQLNSEAMSSLDKTIERSREMATRIAELVADRRDARTNRALQLIGFLLSSTVIFTLTEVSSKAFEWPPLTTLLISIIGIVIVIALGLAIFFKR